MANITFLNSGFFNSQVFAFVVVPILIFAARALDVSIGSVRVIFLARGRRVAAILGFFEVLIWLVVITQIMQNLSNPVTYIAYAAGFATGTYVGILLEGKLALGHLLVQVITEEDAPELLSCLRDAGHGVTSVEAQGAHGRVQLLHTVIRRKNLQPVVNAVTRLSPSAFISVDEVQSATRGIFPAPASYRTKSPVALGRRHKTK
ncbi:MAG: DUF2179 domain-containing protein [Ardenticatenia bacterium]|nr:DUF2179 domain-containing protein [Ardenticatenia bacterium]